MEINEIVKLLDAKVICGHNRLHEKVASAFASDLMSDVLTLDTERMMLITGLCNPQTIRTAEMADISCILFVRAKKVPDEMKSIACENNMVIIECGYSMFKTVGLLFANGMKPVY